jgi:hypothetical protein
VLVPPNHYTQDFNLLNFTLPNGGNTASQVQAIGINPNSGLGGATPFPDIVGFYTDKATGFTHGFLDSFSVQSTIDDPLGLPPNVTTPVQNLLGINNALRAAGFWTDNAGHEHGFVVEINTQTTPVSTTFTELTPAARSSLISGLWASSSSTRLTAIRVPRTTGFPPKILGSAVIRSSCCVRCASFMVSQLYHTGASGNSVQIWLGDRLIPDR